MEDTQWARFRPAGSWPEDLDDGRATATGSAGHSTTRPTDPQPQPSDAEPRGPPKIYPPKTCRICLETVYPTYHPASENIPGFMQPKPRVTYESADPELGRLLRPCKCKGSSRYVHEKCLSLWRHADPGYGRRNFWQCPTCGFQYRLDRMLWGQWISNPITQIFLTLMVLLLIMFLLGFVADPIINLYVDPYDTLLSGELLEGSFINRAIPQNTEPTWTEHFVKGLASLGVLSFLKVVLAMSPWHWWNLRSSGIMGGRGGRTVASGRDRVSSVSWIVIAVGVVTFLVSLYKGVRAYSCSILERAGQRVLDVPLDDEEDDEEGNEAQEPSSNVHAKNE